MTEIEELAARVEALEDKLNFGPIVMDHDGYGPALYIHQAGNGSAVVVQNDTDNPAIVGLALGNAAAFEGIQSDHEDVFSCPEGDGRFCQMIVDRACVRDAVKLAREGGIVFDNVLRRVDQDLAIGCSDQDYGLRVQVDQRPVRFECGGELIMTVSTAGLKVYKEAP